MVLQKHHLWLIAFVVVVGIAYYAQRIENGARADRDRAASVAACVKSSTRDAYEAAGFLVLSDRVGRRDNPGDQASARRYLAVATSVAATLDRPANVNDPALMVEVELIEGPGEKFRYDLTSDAKERIEVGCRQAFE